MLASYRIGKSRPRRRRPGTRKLSAFLVSGTRITVRAHSSAEERSPYKREAGSSNLPAPTEISNNCTAFSLVQVIYLPRAIKKRVRSIGCATRKSGTPDKSEIDLVRVAEEPCGKWMPRKTTTCARTSGHAPPCMTAENMKSRRAYRRNHPHLESPESKKKSAIGHGHRAVRL